jgi:hypothetical protein
MRCCKYSYVIVRSQPKNVALLLLTAVYVAPEISGSADRQNKDIKVAVLWHALNEYSVEWHKPRIGNKKFIESCGKKLSSELASRLRRLLGMQQYFEAELPNTK